MSKMIAAMTFLALFAVGCVTGEDEARETLYKSGYTDVGTGDVAWFGCGEGDFKGREFNAKNAQGMRVNGVVCCGMMKGCTVRF